MITLFREQPRAFYMIFMLEIWERFGFYTVQGILVLYFVRFAGLTYQDSYATFGAFSALLYGLVALGGYLGDRVLGTKRTLVLGLIVLAVGYLALALADKQRIYYALALICVGGGLFKANPSNLLAKSYDSQDSRLHSGFTLYYMAINLGAIVALFAGPALSSLYGYPYAYFASFLGILLGLANYGFQRKHITGIHTPADDHIIRAWQWGLVVFGVMGLAFASAYLLQHVILAKNILWWVTLGVVSVYFFYMRHENQSSRMRMLLAFILMLEAVAFFTLYQQMPMSLNLFAVNNVHAHFFSMSLDPQSFQALNGMWIILMSPVFAMVYHRLNRAGIVFATPYKFALGMTCCGVGFLSLYFCRFVHDTHGMVSSGWLVGAYLFQSMGELLVSALGVAMVAELVPEKMTGFVMGAWFLTSAVAGFTGASVASYTALASTVQPGLDSLMIYTRVFGCIGMAALFVALLMWLISPRLNRLMGHS